MSNQPEQFDFYIAPYLIRVYYRLVMIIISDIFSIR